MTEERQVLEHQVTEQNEDREGGSRVENGRQRRSVLIAAAAAALGVSRRTVYYYIRAGRLQTIRTRGGSQRVLWASIESCTRVGLVARPTDAGDAAGEREV